MLCHFTKGGGEKNKKTETDKNANVAHVAQGYQGARTCPALITLIDMWLP